MNFVVLCDIIIYNKLKKSGICWLSLVIREKSLAKVLSPWSKSKVWKDKITECNNSKKKENSILPPVHHILHSLLLCFSPNSSHQRETTLWYDHLKKNHLWLPHWNKYTISSYVNGLSHSPRQYDHGCLHAASHHHSSSTQSIRGWISFLTQETSITTANKNQKSHKQACRIMCCLHLPRKHPDQNCLLQKPHWTTSQLHVLWCMDDEITHMKHQFHKKINHACESGFNNQECQASRQ
jgi:hypothetical protein